MERRHDVATQRVTKHADRVPRISAPQAIWRLQRGEPLAFVDARPEVEWRTAVDKLRGAVRLAPDDMDETLPLIRRGQTAVVYCTGPEERSSVAAADYLIHHGCPNVQVLHGGLAAWRLAQGPVEPARAASRLVAEAPWSGVSR
jgi:rhodanese-related sulfurtransferase